MSRAILLLGAVLLIVPAQGQQVSKGKKTTEPVAQNPAPTVGFAHIKDVSPVTDSDAYHEELEMEKKLPNNPFVYDKRVMHEASLMNDFLEGFKDSKACNGITFYLTKDTSMGEGKKPDFIVQITVIDHD